MQLPSSSRLYRKFNSRAGSEQFQCSSSAVLDQFQCSCGVASNFMENSTPVSGHFRGSFRAISGQFQGSDRAVTGQFQHPLRIQLWSSSSAILEDPPWNDRQFPSNLMREQFGCISSAISEQGPPAPAF